MLNLVVIYVKVVSSLVTPMTIGAHRTILSALSGCYVHEEQIRICLSI
jgi:hypothetical protein